MTIYQVVDEQNHPVNAFTNIDSAAKEVEILNECFEEHYYFLNELELAT
jgi:hypothetical protein